MVDLGQLGSVHGRVGSVWVGWIVSGWVGSRSVWGHRSVWVGLWSI